MQTLIQLGLVITGDAEIVCGLLTQFGISDASPPWDNQGVEIVSSLAHLAAEGTALWDVGVLVRALSSFVSLSLRPYLQLITICPAC